MKDTIQKTLLLILINLISFLAFAQFNNAFIVKITGSNYSDETIIRLLNDATESFDSNYDSWKLFNPNPNVPSIYTQVASGQELSINSLPEFTEDKSIIIFTNIPVSGVYTITVEQIFELTNNYKVSLTDLSSSTHYRILGDTSLSFTFNTQQNSPSFQFNISTLATTATTKETCFNSNDGTLLINNAGNSDWVSEIYDLNNNLIASNNANSNISNFNNLSSGNYIAKISSKGIIDEIIFTIDSALNLTADFSLNNDTVYLNEGAEINITNSSLNASNYSWDFGDGGTTSNANPNYIYSSVGDYQVKLSSYNSNCVSQNTKSVTVLLSSEIITSIKQNNQEEMSISYYANYNYQIETNDIQNKRILVYDVKGAIVIDKQFTDKNYMLSLSNNTSGIYIINVTNEKNQTFKQKIFR